MRDILFRGKRIDSGDWVYGFYAHIPCGRFGKDEHLIQQIKKDGKIGILVDVDPDTVGQYTGLTDRIGVKIFEGDIVKLLAFDDEEKYLFEVKFGKCGGVQNVLHDVGYIGFYLASINSTAKQYDSFGLRNDILYWVNEKFSISVIGNVHDNPELLEVQDEKTD